VTGCSDPEADNYDCTVNVDDGSCAYPGCTDPAALNFAIDANVDDGSCCYSEGECQAPEEFTFLQENAQGLAEYRHDETGIVFVLLPGGDFEMGSPDTEPNRSSDEGPVHTVTLSPFLIAKYECTQAEYAAVMDSNPSNFTGDVLRPVERVSWDDLHAADGFLERTGMLLPTEAQWEYAARGGTSTAFSFGDECNANGCNPCATADDFMWWCGNAGGTTHPVGEKLPNPFGLHDMHGNVFEWCEDVDAVDFYESEAAAGPDPVADSGSGDRARRGGSWDRSCPLCRSASRPGTLPSNHHAFNGFRPARPFF
jgi:formylglycine-generating enzyme required for sulfatase activity